MAKHGLEEWKYYAFTSLLFVILLIISLAFTIQTNEASEDQLVARIAHLQKENDRLELQHQLDLERLNYYKVNKEYLMSIGATENQADLALKASTLHHVDPKF